LKLGLVLAGVLMGTLLLSCEKKEEKAQDTTEQEKKEEVSITKGSMGKWGSIPMTPQPVTKEEAEELARWILSIK